MKFKILLYSFLFVCILLFYQIYNTNKILKHKDIKIQNLNLNKEKLKDSIYTLNNFRNALNYFSVESNKKIDLEFSKANIFKQKTEQKLFEMNTKGGLNKLLKLPEGKFLIENVQVINQNWVLIGYRSDSYWGEAFLEIKSDEYQNKNFKIIKYFVQPL